VLHVNDIHAHYDPSDANFGTTCDLENGAPTCFGGVARLATAIAEAKAEGAAAGMDTLVLHAGDQFTGTLWDVVYTSNGYLIGAPFLKELGVQAFTFGNHEFDHGPELAAQFAANLTELGVPVLACNLDVSKEPAFDGIELQVHW
jgi:5'-nucleotidase